MLLKMCAQRFQSHICIMWGASRFQEPKQFLVYFYNPFWLGSEHKAGLAGRLLPFFCITQHMILAPQLAFKFVKEDRGKVLWGIQLCPNQACLSFGWWDLILYYNISTSQTSDLHLPCVLLMVLILPLVCLTGAKIS